MAKANVRHISSGTWVRASSGVLINLIKWVLKYYLEVILYNCVYKMIGSR